MITRTALTGVILSASSLAPLAASHAAEPLRLSVTSGLAENHVVPTIMRTHFQDEVTRRLAEAGGWRDHLG